MQLDEAIKLLDPECFSLARTCQEYREHAAVELATERAEAKSGRLIFLTNWWQVKIGPDAIGTLIDLAAEILNPVVPIQIADRRILGSLLIQMFVVECDRRDQWPEWIDRRLRAARASRWISATDRLPDRDGRYLVRWRDRSETCTAIG
jgi:hypothetical protein